MMRIEYGNISEFKKIVDYKFFGELGLIPLKWAVIFGFLVSDIEDAGTLLTELINYWLA
ncbi:MULTISPECIES: hypothetical protein [Snodgrassella]|uniref:hypothetical protein n=1 Tax=Snodgrassella TaxID=1193515 RepID=UPI00159EF7C6|nr:MULTISPECIES: hypothetical protein [Snodgrassella]MCO6512915.1 hypothetical protein [Snodgrassella sp.]MCO6518232.1 hypothetical protein [Snodgrassella sp.]MCO6519713.1 hypothetical protein [Snodgrassella sp.]